MLIKKRIPLFIAIICVLEVAIYLWAIWTTKEEFVFDKCARNSGRVSSLINLSMLIMLGYFGLSQIYQDKKKRVTFLILITLFAVNHAIHFYYVYQNFKFHTKELDITDNFHGFITFVFILFSPIVLWTSRKMNTLLHIGIILHLGNVSYFIMETFYSKIKPDAPAYHNQLGIFATSLALIYVLYGAFKEFKSS